MTGVERFEVELTADGYVRIAADIAARFFPGDALVAMARGAELWLIPLIGPQGGGLLLKQRNARGDRAALVWEALPPGDTPRGVRAAYWDGEAGAVRVDLSVPS